MSISTGISYHTLLNRFLSKLSAAKKMRAQADEGLRNDPTNLYESYQILKLKLHQSLQDQKNALATLEILTHKHIFYQIETAFLAKNYLKQKLSVNQEVFLHCYPIYNEYSYLLDNLHLLESISLSPFLHSNFLTFRTKEPSQ